MEPNTNTNLNQQMDTNPLGQPSQPVAQSAPATMGTTQPSAPAEMNVQVAPKGKGGNTIALLVILLLLIVGIAGYVVFTKIQLSNEQKSAAENTSVATPQPTATPTLAPESDIEISSPEADLIDLENDAKGL